ncbi:MAG: dimethyl sulfoxide reductase anchor subunit [Nitrospirota bacterium]|nr:dimethyl sulfoxide reductase anchor subunit [Nitrospirota bacterium]
MSLTPIPQRQNAFHFTASNCIGCHSCEAACSEKNGLKPHIAWRKVGYVESGEFPHYRRVNTSMACNHCDNPVCLKGCPTRAYVKYADTGAVVQDSSVCFGCQYCTWVCPYGAPVFDPEVGTVSKCNMCVDRLAVGLKPACVAACLGHALEFGKREELPDRFNDVREVIPGFPDPSITRPNVRFAFSGTTADHYTRPDSMNLAYQNQCDAHHPVALPAPRREVFSWQALQSSETPLAVFTLIAQGVVGAFCTGLVAVVAGNSSGDFPLPSPLQGLLLAGLSLLLAYGLFTSTMHLGRPRFFYRAMNNLRYSWVSREILFMGGFMTLLLACAAAWWLGLPSATRLALGGVTAVTGVLGIFCMGMIYRIPARPYWHHPHTFVAFAASGLILGPLGVGAVAGVYTLANGSFSPAVGILQISCAMTALVTVGLERLSARRHTAWLATTGGEAEAALWLLVGTLHAAYTARGWASLALLPLCTGIVIAPSPELKTAGVLAALGTALMAETLGRLLFYMAVVPTTMPGAFFLKNRGFEKLARETGLAADPAVGVAPDPHAAPHATSPDPEHPAVVPACTPAQHPEEAIA